MGAKTYTLAPSLNIHWVTSSFAVIKVLKFSLRPKSETNVSDFGLRL